MENNTQETMSRCEQYNEKKNREINRENSKQYYQDSKERLQKWIEINTENHLNHQYWSITDENTKKLREYGKSWYYIISQD